MKANFFASTLLAFTLFATATAAQENIHTVNITNLGQVKGDLYIGWYKDPSTFRVNDKAIYREKIPVNKQSSVSVAFKNIPAGKYAIAVFLDENNNYILDKNMLGIPKEKYGFSNNIVPFTRPATFNESVFDLKDEAINITLR